MQKIVKKGVFLKGVWQTLSFGDIYFDITNKLIPRKLSLSIFFGFSFIFGVLFCLILSYFKLLPVSRFISFLPSRLISAFPSDLEITLKEGELSINQPQPYYISTKYIDQLVDGQNNISDNRNLVVIDTRARPESFGIYKTYILLTKDFIVFRDDTGELQIYHFSGMPDVSVNKEFIKMLTRIASPYLLYVFPLIVGGLFLYQLVLKPLLFLLLSYFVAFLYFGLFKVFMLGGGYAQSQQVAIHTLALCLAATSITALLKIPFLYSVPFFIVLFVTITVIRIRNFSTSHSYFASNL